MVGAMAEVSMAQGITAKVGVFQDRATPDVRVAQGRRHSLNFGLGLAPQPEVSVTQNRCHS
jgi:hypothetical protein